MTRRSWTTVEPKDAKDLQLPNDEIYGPANEMGEECPWPWEPQQLVGAPLGQYHCGYCGAMVIAGVPHVDYTETLSPECEVGKHQACAGEALDERSDDIVRCTCPCHFGQAGS